MRANNKIVFMDGMFPAIFFPVGHPEEGGSCDFLTHHCKEYCPGREQNEHERRALLFFRSNNINIITERILDEISMYAIMHLYWWPWGDCPRDMTEKIAKIMLRLNKTGLLQNGFTRNRKLWQKIPADNRLRIGYHAETIEEAKSLSKKKITCCPDVGKGKGILYHNGNKIARCCGIWCEWLTLAETRIADCQECYLYGQGCFYRY